MKNVSMTVILISALTITLVSTVIFNGIQQVRAEDEENEDDKGQCNNVIVYGVVCMPGAVCELENFDVPFELVTPF